MRECWTCKYEKGTTYLYTMMIRETDIQNMWIILNSFNTTQLERRMKFKPEKQRSYFFRV